MDIREYLDATYLKTAGQAGLSPMQNIDLVRDLVHEAIAGQYKLVMVRPDMVPMAVELVNDARSSVLVGTVIDFPEGDGGLEKKFAEAREAIANGAHDLDFVADYKAFKKGIRYSVAAEITACTMLCLEHGRVAKWIIEVAALTNDEIKGLCTLIKDIVIANAGEADYNRVFIKSSTGFYDAGNGKPNGATPETIKLMLAHAGPLPVKAAGGVRTYNEALEMIKLGVKRIGTSAAKTIAEGGSAAGGGY